MPFITLFPLRYFDHVNITRMGIEANVLHKQMFYILVKTYFRTYDIRDNYQKSTACGLQTVCTRRDNCCPAGNVGYASSGDKFVRQGCSLLSCDSTWRSATRIVLLASHHLCIRQSRNKSKKQSRLAQHYTKDTLFGTTPLQAVATFFIFWQLIPPFFFSTKTSTIWLTNNPVVDIWLYQYLLANFLPQIVVHCPPGCLAEWWVGWDWDVSAAGRPVWTGGYGIASWRETAVICECVAVNQRPTSPVRFHVTINLKWFLEG